MDAEDAIRDFQETARADPSKYHELLMGLRKLNLTPEQWKRALQLYPNKQARKAASRKRYRKKYYDDVRSQERARYLKRQFPHLTVEEYDKLTEKCEICGWQGKVDLHHINGKKDDKRLIGLCPNHHLILHEQKLSLVELLAKHQENELKY